MPYWRAIGPKNGCNCLLIKESDGTSEYSHVLTLRKWMGLGLAYPSGTLRFSVKSARKITKFAVFRMEPFSITSMRRSILIELF